MLADAAPPCADFVVTMGGLKAHGLLERKMHSRVRKHVSKLRLRHLKLPALRRGASIRLRVHGDDFQQPAKASSSTAAAAVEWKVPLPPPHAHPRHAVPDVAADTHSVVACCMDVLHCPSPGLACDAGLAPPGLGRCHIRPCAGKWLLSPEQVARPPARQSQLICCRLCHKHEPAAASPHTIRSAPRPR